jgi:hypothetical protein
LKLILASNRGCVKTCSEWVGEDQFHRIVIANFWAS